MVSELGTAFRMGLFLFVPMLLIDLLVAVVLMLWGMMNGAADHGGAALKAGGVSPRWRLASGGLFLDSELLMSLDLPSALMA